MTENHALLITKASGQKVPFSEEKLRRSMVRAGASDELIAQIIPEIKRKLREGISTRKIYRMAFSLLRRRSGHLAARYNLKRAIMGLGPAGFLFERFVARLLEAEHYSTQTGQVVRGKCVNHEIDVIAEKENHHYMVECKYHNQPGTICDVKIPLYIHARFKDVENQWLLIPGHEKKFHQGWVVTNTRFSADAVQYGACAGLYLLGWDYPLKNSLKERIDRLGVYPVTCLVSLPESAKVSLMAQNILLCRDLLDRPQALEEAGIRRSLREAAMLECAQLLGQPEIVAKS